MKMNKAELNKWHHQILEHYEANDWIEVKKFSSEHVRIKRIKDGVEMDYWPSTGRAKWLIQNSVHFKIRFLDSYLDLRFL